VWLPNLPVTDEELYQRLKRRNVLIVPGHYFSPGLTGRWRHKNECIRINYSQDEQIVTAGLKIIADEIKRTYGTA